MNDRNEELHALRRRLAGGEGERPADDRPPSQAPLGQPAASKGAATGPITLIAVVTVLLGIAAFTYFRPSSKAPEPPVAEKGAPAPPPAQGPSEPLTDAAPAAAGQAWRYSETSDGLLTGVEQQACMTSPATASFPWSLWTRPANMHLCLHRAGDEERVSLRLEGGVQPRCGVICEIDLEWDGNGDGFSSAEDGPDASTVVISHDFAFLFGLKNFRELVVRLPTNHGKVSARFNGAGIAWQTEMEAATAQLAAQPWTYTDVDARGGQPASKLACTSALAWVDKSSLPYVSMDLCLMSTRADGDQAYLVLTGASTFECPDTAGCRVTATFDRGPPQPFPAARSAEGAGAIFIDDPQRFIARLRASKTVTVQAPRPGVPAQPVDFNVVALVWEGRAAPARSARAETASAAPAAPAAARAAPAAPVITDPDWLQRPSGDDMARYYPERAQRLDMSGSVVLQCEVKADGGVSGCFVESETPEDFGFGAAALNLSSLFRMRPLTRGGRPVDGGKVRIPIAFRIS